MTSQSEGALSDRTGPYRVLSLDGGGIRGLIEATLLAEIEDRTGQPIYDLFDLIVGTSTGGLIALLLTCPQSGRGSRPLSAKDVVGLFESRAHEIFPKSLVTRARMLLRPRYSAGPLEALLRELFGEVLLESALKHVLIS